MDSKNTGSFLNNSFPVDENLGGMLSLISDLSASPESSLLPPVMLHLPQSYRTRAGNRVDICGMIVESTEEYKEGYRYFSSAGEFFFADGKCAKSEENPCDIISAIESNDLSQAPRAMTPYLWVHPQHWIAKSWFKPLDPGKIEVKDKVHYLNRMGLAIEIIKTTTTAGVNGMLYIDSEQRYYRANGQCLEKDCSMFDLVSEIRHWKVFIEHDWSSDRVVGKSIPEQAIPELFDPTSGDRRELMQQFFQVMNVVTDLAEQLGIELGFSMKTDGM